MPLLVFTRDDETGAVEPLLWRCEAKGCHNATASQMKLAAGDRAVHLCPSCWERFRKPIQEGSPLSAVDRFENEQRVREAMTQRGGPSRHLVRKGH